MTPIAFWFDPISPYAYLAFERLPQVLEDRAVAVDYKPVLFAGLLKHHGHKGPAEIEPKRQWTFRECAWLGHKLGIRFDLPAQHPFNPLPLLRLMLAAADPMAPLGLPDRRIIEKVLRHVWHGGLDPIDPQRLAALQHETAPFQDPNSDDVKDRLRILGEEAIAKGVFGVPTLEIAGRLFWGLDAFPMAMEALDGDVWFEQNWGHAARKVPGVMRRT